MKTNDIRQQFLDYFKKNNHEVLASSPIVPQHDPTLMFVAAGMVPFKNYFTGAMTPPFSRATTAQKCVRAGGKHNDLENVGYTARHHTFFEMLGNFSFGDYFKEESIHYAWEFITSVVGLPKEKLYITVFHEDMEAFNIWKKITGFGDDRILKIATSDNFWSMGDTGPCGPCTEIFYDHGPSIPGGLPGTPDEDGDRFMEIWNLVFMQYERSQNAQGDIISKDLPKPSIDTGMGIERLAAVLQGVHDNYDTDQFKAIIDASQQLIGHQVTSQNKPSFKVIADHLRASSFLIADGVTPSNEGRGYVLRRIMRRAMRHIHKLGYKDLLMHQLVPTLLTEMGDAYPELVRAKGLVTETLRNEEDKFHVTLHKGMGLLSEELKKLNSNKLPGEVAFKLYDTYGFPLDLTQDILRGENKVVDIEGFNAAMDKQKEEAKANWAGSGGAFENRFLLSLNDQFPSTTFTGYESTKSEGVLTGIVSDNALKQKASEGEIVHFILDKTPFYAESGGQVGDTGTIISKTGEANVLDVQKVQNLFLHKVKVIKGAFHKEDAVTLEVDNKRRSQLRTHHSATHLMHEALRQVLGDHVVQKGSLVAEDRLRFDFTHAKAVTFEERRKVEDIVNALIRQNTQVSTDVSTPDEAVKKGAMALFGEKYGDKVRVVSMGATNSDKPFSVELCGGTHVHATGDMGTFVITDETAVSSGIRRIEALAGEAAYKYIQNFRHQIHTLTSSLKLPFGDVAQKITSLREEVKGQERKIQSLNIKIAQGGSAKNEAEKLQNGIHFAHQHMEGVAAKELRPLMDKIKSANEGVFMLTAANEGKISVVIGVSDGLTLRFDAAKLIIKIVPLMGGQGGGGRPDFAQGGGTDGTKINDAVSHLKDLLIKES